MTLAKTFTDIALDELLDVTAREKAVGARFVQMLCVNTEAGIDLIYSFMAPAAGGGPTDYELRNYKIAAVDAATAEVPSVTGSYLSAFPFENEAHDLFGVNVKDNAIDFHGHFYEVAMDTPMTVITPAQKAAREKAAKLAAAKAAKEAKAAAAANAAGAPADAAAKDAELEKKLAGMDPEKAAKVRAAMAAKAAREKAAAPAAPAAPEFDEAAERAKLEERIAGMDPEKAAKVRAAFDAKMKKRAEAAGAAGAPAKGGE